MIDCMNAWVSTQPSSIWALSTIPKDFCQYKMGILIFNKTYAFNYIIAFSQK